jgi:hypothetical protein
VVNGTKLSMGNQEPNYHEHSIQKERMFFWNKWNSPALLGLLPFMKYSTFKAPDRSHWPNDSF